MPIADIEKFLKEYLAAINEEVDKYNKDIELETYPDLFELWSVVKIHWKSMLCTSVIPET